MIKGELLNVGVILNMPDDGVVKYKFISENNSKLKSILTSKIEKDTYKFGLNYMEFLMKSIDENDTFFAVNAHSSSFIAQVNNQELPKGFIFTENRFAKSSNIDDLFDTLLKEYVGTKFLKEETGVNSMQVKRKATKLINQRTALSQIIQPNVKLRIVENIPRNYTIDFGYVESNKLSMIHSAPDKLNTSYEWLDRMSFISNNYDYSEKISILYNSEAESNKDETMIQMLQFLNNKDERIEIFDIFSQKGEMDFNNELFRIENQAGNIENIKEFVS